MKYIGKTFRMPEYVLQICSAGFVHVLKGMGNMVKWPEKMRALADYIDKEKWCDFHEDHGQTIENCFTLRHEVISLLKIGHLLEHIYFRKKGSNYALQKILCSKPIEGINRTNQGPLITNE